MLRSARAPSRRSGAPGAEHPCRRIDPATWAWPRSEPGVRGGSAVCTLPVADRTVPALRRFVGDVAAGWRVSEEVIHMLRVIATELVTNVLQHSGSPDVSVLLAVHDSVVSIHVSDVGRWREQQGEQVVPEEEAVSGRGLRLVRAYATRFSVDRTVRGTTARVEIEMPGSIGA
ncbi:ATP-binding protein [Streptomyces sp. CA-106131]|uniref:ATP-binding protein n=1 Tax=Streptomyces sp. CA-106131 TaxID=3240045 RepID=UPI003D8D73F7